MITINHVLTIQCETESELQTIQRRLTDYASDPSNQTYKSNPSIDTQQLTAVVEFEITQNL